MLQIHDELVYEIEESVLEKAEKIIKQAMEGVLRKVLFALQNRHSAFGAFWFWRQFWGSEIENLPTGRQVCVIIERWKAKVNKKQ